MVAKIKQLTTTFQCFLWFMGIAQASFSSKLTCYCQKYPSCKMNLVLSKTNVVLNFSVAKKKSLHQEWEVNKYSANCSLRRALSGRPRTPARHSPEYLVIKEWFFFRICFRNLKTKIHKHLITWHTEWRTFSGALLCDALFHRWKKKELKI